VSHGIYVGECLSPVRVSIEAGGNAPFIVFDDADIESAVEGMDQIPIIFQICLQNFKVQFCANSVDRDRPAYAPTEYMSKSLSMRNLLQDLQRRFPLSRSETV
jgi:Aldehyde dehydrogenase family